VIWSPIAGEKGRLGEWSYCRYREKRAAGSRVVEARRICGPRWKGGLRLRLARFTM
jgi:hypothetical protein